MSSIERVDDLMSTSGVAFGTSGARGRVDAMTDRVCFAYASAFFSHLESSGQLGAKRRVAIAGDRRQSTPRISIAIATAARANGFEVDYCGEIPTPTVAAWGQHR